MIASIDGLSPEEWMIANQDKNDFYSKIAQFLKDWAVLSEFNCYSSGSTGSPKRISFSKEQMVSSAKGTISYFNLPKHAQVLLALDPDYIAGKMMLVRAIVGEWHLHTCLPDNVKNIKLYQNIDFTALVPLQTIYIIENKAINFIHKVLVGGQKYPAALEAIEKPYQDKLFESYGMTETLSHVAIKPRVSDFFDILPGNQIKLNKDACITIQCNYLPQLITTNDLGTLVDGKLNIIGRKDWVINSGGVKFQIEELEQKYAKLLPSIAYFITGLPDPKLGQKIVLIIEGPAFDLNLKQIALSKYEIAKEIIFIAKFIRNNGKILRVKTLELI